MSALSDITPCPGCGVESSEDYGGTGRCWRCYRSANGSSDDNVTFLAAPGGVDPPREGDQDPLAGQPMDPAAEPVEPLPPLAGFPFIHQGAAAVIVGPTGGGRSSMIQAGLYELAKAGSSPAYLGSEVTCAEFNARAAVLANLRGDQICDHLRTALAHVRYLDLPTVINWAWTNPDQWARGITERYDTVVIDPLSAASSALGLDFDKGNDDFVKFYDTLVQPIVTAGRNVIMLDNVGHAPEAKKRAVGASAKGWKPDLSFWCKAAQEPAGLVIVAGKVRSMRAGHQTGDEWISRRDSQRIERLSDTSEPSKPPFRPTGLMQMSYQAIANTPGLSRSSIRKQVRGNESAGRLALDLLIADGYVNERIEGAQKLALYPIRTYVETDDPKCSA